MADDIVKRLRSHSKHYQSIHGTPFDSSRISRHVELLDEAADLIERLLPAGDRMADSIYGLSWLSKWHRPPETHYASMTKDVLAWAKASGLDLRGWDGVTGPSRQRH